MIKWFTKLRPNVKITLFICIAVVVMTVVIVAGLTGEFGELIELIFREEMPMKK